MDGMRWNLGRLDSLLQAALLLRLGEQGQARDLFYDLVARIDPDEQRIDAFSYGTFDALVRAHLVGTSALPVLLYLLKLNEHGPGAATVDAAERALASGRFPVLEPYVELGRRMALRALEGNAPRPGSYAQRLLDELTDD